MPASCDMNSSRVFNHDGTDLYWLNIGFIDGIAYKPFDKEEVVSILCDAYRGISDYVNSNKDIDREKAFLYLPIYRRIFQSTIGFIRDGVVPLKSYIDYLCDWKDIISFVDHTFDKVYSGLSILPDMDTQAETCYIISQSFCNRNGDLIRNHKEMIIRGARIESIIN